MAKKQKRRLTLRAFEREYAERSGESVEWLWEHGRVAAPCDCRNPGCEGFQMLHYREENDHGR